ncbi:MAG: hypothetical protein ABMA64_35445 [Myxococcota bacterium]
MRRIETYDWWQDLVLQKDDLSLRELADRFDVTPGAISAAFKRTGLSRKAAPPGPRVRRTGGRSEAQDESDGLPPEAGDAARPGSKDGAIRPLAHLLGQVPDAEVAQRAGVSVRTIASYRSRHGLDGYKGPRKRGADRMPRKSRIDEFAHLVGQVPDRQVAEQAGVSLNAVRNWRMRHGVTAGGRVDADRSPNPVSRGSSAPHGGHGAWKVTAPGLVKVVVAPSLTDAANRAQEAGIGTVLSLEWIGEVL